MARTPRSPAARRAPSVGRGAGFVGVSAGPPLAATVFSLTVVTFVYAYLTSQGGESKASWAFTFTVTLASMNLVLEVVNNGIAAFASNNMKFPSVDGTDASLLPVYYHVMNKGAGGCQLAGCAGVTLCFVSTLFGPLGRKVPGVGHLHCLLDKATSPVFGHGNGRRHTCAAVGSALLVANANGLCNLDGLMGFFTNFKPTVASLFIITTMLPLVNFLIGAATKQSLKGSGALFDSTNTLLATAFLVPGSEVGTLGGNLNTIGFVAGAAATVGNAIPVVKDLLAEHRNLITVACLGAFSWNALFEFPVPDPRKLKTVSASQQAFQWTCFLACAQFLYTKFAKGGAGSISNLSSLALIMYLSAGNSSGATHACHAGLAATVLGLAGGANAQEGQNFLTAVSVLLIVYGTFPATFLPKPSVNFLFQ